MIFGGAFFSHLDKAAATAVNRALYDSEGCRAAVTYKFEGSFHKPCYIGDLIFITAKIVSVGKKSVVVEVEAHREKRGDRELVADAKFVFVSIVDATQVGHKPELLPYAQHGLKMPT